MNQIKPSIKKINIKKVLISLLAGAFVTVWVVLFVLDLYNKREVLVYSYLNPSKVEALKVADEKTKEDADQKLKDNLSRVFINEDLEVK